MEHKGRRFRKLFGGRAPDSNPSPDQSNSLTPTGSVQDLPLQQPTSVTSNVKSNEATTNAPIEHVVQPNPTEADLAANLGQLNLGAEDVQAYNLNHAKFSEKFADRNIESSKSGNYANSISPSSSLHRTISNPTPIRRNSLGDIELPPKSLSLAQQNQPSPGDNEHATSANTPQSSVNFLDRRYSVARGNSSSSTDSNIYSRTGRKPTPYFKPGELALYSDDYDDEDERPRRRKSVGFSEQPLVEEEESGSQRGQFATAIVEPEAALKPQTFTDLAATDNEPFAVPFRSGTTVSKQSKRELSPRSDPIDLPLSHSLNNANARTQQTFPVLASHDDANIPVLGHRREGSGSSSLHSIPRKPLSPGTLSPTSDIINGSPKMSRKSTSGIDPMSNEPGLVASNTPTEHSSDGSIPALPTYQTQRTMGRGSIFGGLRRVSTSIEEKEEMERLETRKYEIENSEVPIEASDVVDLSNTSDVSYYSRFAPAVTHETIISPVHNIREEQITREIHNHDVFHRILPIKEVEVLPARHFIRDRHDNLLEVSSCGIQSVQYDNSNQSLLDDANPSARDPIPFKRRAFTARSWGGEEGDGAYKELIGEDGIKKTETTWVHPTTLEDGGMLTGQTEPIIFIHHDPMEGRIKESGDPSGRRSSMPGSWIDGANDIQT